MRLRLLLLSFPFIACTPAEQPAPAAPVTAAGDLASGQQLIEKYACLACHHIPGFEEPHGTLGPSLAGTASRPTIAGRAVNDPPTMILYLQNPAVVDPPTRMPALGISEAEARDITAYLFTLK